MDYHAGPEVLMIGDSMESRKVHERLSLAEAQRLGRLDEFIAQEEARGIGPIERADFDAALAKVVKEPRSKSRTSRSASRDGSSGTETRQGSDPYTSR